MKIIARHVAASAVLAGAVLGALALPAQADGIKADTDISVPSEGGNDEVFPNDIYGYEDPKEFIQN